MPSSPERQAVSSNISQNFPYASETEAARAAAVEKAVANAPGLREKIAAEATGLGKVEPDDNGAPVRWWVWVCPRDDFKGRLHVAGYALDRHALYTVCDTHGDTYLR
jgi:hypothetical protein